ncbi:MAG: hypothetical protein ACXVWU_02410 [Nocardioides sp.]
MIVAFTAGSLLAVLIVVLASPRGFVASARVQQSSTSVSTDTQANSVVNQVRGIATSPAVVGQAMRAAGVHGLSPMAVGKHDVTVTQIGSSTVVDISVKNDVPQTAQKLSNALARIVVDTLGGQLDARKRQLITQLRSEQQRLYGNRQSLLTTLSRTSTPDQVASLSAQLTALDMQLADIASTLRQLAVPDATDGSAMFISPAQEALPAHRNLLLNAVLALLAGLVAGLLVACGIEVLRPRVADARTIARDLGVPFLGRATMTGAADGDGHGSTAGTDLGDEPDDVEARAGDDEHVHLEPETLVALRGTAAQTSTSSVVILGCGQPAEITSTLLSLTSRLRSALGVPAAQNGRAGRVTRERPAWEPNPDALGHDLPGQRIVDVALVASLAQESIPGPGRAILVVAELPAPQVDVDRVSDLSAATGWPVLGVLEVVHSHGARTPREDSARAGLVQQGDAASGRTEKARGSGGRSGDRV